jgi:hypothetical protein
VTAVTANVAFTASYYGLLVLFRSRSNLTVMIYGSEFAKGTVQEW